MDGLRYGYEEALGYCVDPEGVRDKDGITAALLSPSWPPSSSRTGRTLPDLLDDLAVEHGLHATDQLSVRVEDLSLIADAMRAAARAAAGRAGGPAVAAAEDLTQGTDTLPPTDGLRYYLPVAEAASRPAVIVRPSGTEPKLKCYLEVVVPVAAPEALPEARTKAAATLAAIKRDLSAAAGI